MTIDIFKVLRNIPRLKEAKQRELNAILDSSLGPITEKRGEKNNLYYWLNRKKPGI